MTDKGINEIKKVVSAYKQKKIELKAKTDTIEKEVKEGRRLPWHADSIKNELYREFSESPEVEKFQEMSAKANNPNEVEFEEKFREIHLFEFFGLKPRKHLLYQISDDDLYFNHFSEEDYLDMSNAITENEIYAVGAKIANKVFEVLNFTDTQKDLYRTQIIDGVTKSPVLKSSSPPAQHRVLINSHLMSTIQGCDYAEKERQG